MAYCYGSNERKAKVCKSLALKKLFFTFALHIKWVVSLCSAGELPKKNLESNDSSLHDQSHYLVGRT